MKNIPKGLVISVLFIIIAVLLGGAAIYVYSQKEQVDTPVVESSPEAQATKTFNVQSADLKTYTNNTYGFSFQYPKTSLFGTTDYGSIKTFARSPIAYVRIDGNFQTEGYMTISISSDSSEVAKCTTHGAFVSLNNTETLAGNAKNTTINGVSYLQYDVTSHDLVAGAERQYTAVRNGSCVAIRLSAFPSSCINSGCTNRQWSKETETAMIDQLDGIAQSVKFK